MKKEKYLKIGLSLVEIALILGMYTINYYSKRKMGFMRYLVYLNRKLENLFFTNNFKIALIIILILGISFHLYKFYRLRKIEFLIVFLAVFIILMIEKVVFSGIINTTFILGCSAILAIELFKYFIFKSNRF